MPKILDLLKTQKYTEKEIFEKDEDLFKVTVNVDKTLPSYRLSEEIASDNSIEEALSQGSEGITALQYVTEQRLYTTKTPRFFASHSLYNQTKNRISLSYEDYTAERYNADNFSRVFAALIKPFADKKENNHFTDLILMQNKYGETALHSYFRNFKKWAPIQPVFDRIVQLSPEQKKQIMTISDNQGLNIIHIVAEKARGFNFIQYLDADDLCDALIQQDNLSKTPLHYLFSQGHGAISDIQLIAKKLNERKDNSYAEKIILKTDNTSRNILHYALGYVNSSEAKEKVVAALGFFKNEVASESGTEDKKSLTETQGTIFFNALTTADANGLTPFQYACKNNHDAAIELIFQLLNPEQQKVLIVQDKNKALHFACRSGKKTMIDKILNALGPKETYEIFKAERVTLRQLVRDNHNLNLNNFEKTVNEKIGWFQTYDYLKQREKETPWFHPVADFDKRADDFIKRLHFKGSTLPTLCDPSFGNGQSKRYKAKISHLNIDQKQQDDLKLMIQSDTTDPLDYKIAASLDSKCVLSDIKQYLVRLKTAEDQAKYWSWNKQFDKYMGDFINCLRAIQESGRIPAYPFDQTALYKKFRNGLEFVPQEQVARFLEEIDKNTVKDVVIKKLNDSFPPSVNPSRSLKQ